MSQLESPESTPEPTAVDPENASTPEPEPEPEPWTADRVVEWNRYYDLYVACAVLLLLFVVSSHRVVNSLFWVHLQSGRLMLEKGGLLLADPFSFALEGGRWVHVSWLYDLATIGLYQAGSAISASAGVPTLVAVNSILVVLSGLILLSIRRPGPGLWWSAVCVVLAMGVMVAPAIGVGASPLIVSLGGLAGRSEVESETWAMLLLAIELLLLDRGTDRGSFLGRGSTRALFGLVPVFLIWVNVDASFLIGLLIASAWLLGSAIRPRRPIPADLRKAPRNREDEETGKPLSIGLGLGIAGGCLVACLANPSFHHAFGAGASPIFERFFASVPPLREYLSFLSRESFDFFKRQHEGSSLAAALYPTYYLAVVSAGLLSFWVNRSRFSLGRFFGYVVAALAWGLLVRYSFIFAPVLAAVLALNGQEWFLDRFGSEGHLGRGWTAWSVGGRALTLIVIIAALLRGLTGFGAASVEVPFGFGFLPEEFAFEGADAVRDPKIEGNVLNLGTEQGDALIWRAYPDRKCYVDDRPNAYPASVRDERARLRVALRDGVKDVYKPILDRLKVSVLMLSPHREPRTYLRLASSDDFILFHDDGNSALFGRVDAPPSELAYFKQRQLDANEVVYKRPASIPISDRPPTTTTWIDRYFPSRLQVPTQPHDFVAGRWLDAGRGPGGNLLPDAAYCIAAIREARIAISKNADDHDAYVLLARAYGYLAIREAEIQARGGSTGGNLPLRTRQRTTALNYAIQTAPPIDDAEAKLKLAQLHAELAQLYQVGEMLDLQRDQMQATRDLLPADRFPEADRDRLSQLNRAIDDLQSRITEQSAAQQAGPAQRAQMALSVGLVGLAIRELKEADQLGGNNATVKGQLIDLYCRSGQPDQALEMLGNPGDPALGADPGTALYRQGLDFLLMGNYETSVTYWENAILQVRSSLAYQSMEGLLSILRGAPRGVAAFQELPGRVGQEAAWEFDLGLCLLEGGKPDLAAEHLAKSVELSPRFGARPLVVYYLDKLGKPLVNRETAPK